MLIFIDSSKRINKNSQPNNIIFQLNQSYNAFKYVKLLHMWIARSIYTINENNNKLLFIFSDSTIKIINIPIKNYDPDE